MEALYGILSDCHKSSPLAVEQAIQRLKSFGAQYLILNGDITGEQNPHRMPPQYFLQYVLKAAADTNLETYVQFGSHEEFLPSKQVLSHHRSLYGNIIDVTQHRRIELPGHHLVFLPGSDVNAGGEYTFGTDLPSGTFLKTKDGLMMVENPQQYPMCAQMLQQGQAEGIMHYENIGDIAKYVTTPEKTIVICHVPPKFNNLEHAVDRAVFGEVTAPFMLDKRPVEKGSIFPIHAASQLQKQGAPIAIKQENRGNQELAQLYQQLGITKVINGHFHESAHHAHDHLGQPIKENTFTNSLFWNASYMDAFKAGILRVDGINVVYQNIDLRK